MFRENVPWKVCGAKIDDHIFPILPISTNVVYQLLHINKHLVEEGIGLRQLLDYYFVLRALHIDQGSFSDRTESMVQWAEGMDIAVKSNEEILHTLSRFGMKKFAGAVMYVLQTVFAMPDEYLLCPPNEKEGVFLLDESCKQATSANTTTASSMVVQKLSTHGRKPNITSAYSLTIPKKSSANLSSVYITGSGEDLNFGGISLLTD